MDSDAGGWLWFVMDVVFVLALAGALLYGTMQWKKRRRSTDKVREQKTRQLYEDGAREERTRAKG